MFKIEDLRKETPDELSIKLQDTKKKYMELRFQHTSGTLKNPLQIRSIRRDIAKINTIIMEKRVEGE